MALPVMNEKEFVFTKIITPGNKEIGIRRWRVKDKKEFLFSVDGVDDPKVINKEIVNFMEKCVDDPKLFKTLSETDMISVAAETRKMSKGDELELSYVCPHCGNNDEKSFSITENIKLKEFDSSPIVIDDVTINLKDISYYDKMDIINRYSKVIQQNFGMLYKSVESMMWNDKLYSTFTEKELIEFFDDMNDDQFDKIFTEFLSRGSYFIVKHEFACPACNKSVILQLDKVEDFFV